MDHHINPNLEALEQKLTEHAMIDKLAVNLLLEAWQKTKALNAKDTLISYQQVDSHLYYIAKGCVRLFVVNNEGEEKNIGFGYQNTWITSFQSFVTGKPSLMCIETLMESEVLAITKEKLEELIQSNSSIAAWYRHLIENTLAGHIQRQVELLTLDPQERYEVFRKRSGHLVNSIPLKHIASYLMMTPETLSRVRARIS